MSWRVMEVSISRRLVHQLLPACLVSLSGLTGCSAEPAESPPFDALPAESSSGEVALPDSKDDNGVEDTHFDTRLDAGLDADGRLDQSDSVMEAEAPSFPLEDVATETIGDTADTTVDTTFDATAADSAVADMLLDTSAEGATDTPTISCSASLPGLPASERYRRLRSTVDLPDDNRGEYQVHALYVEPADVTSTTRLDENGSIRRSLEAMNGWLTAQGDGRTLRTDTCDGVADVTYVKLSETSDFIAQGTAREGAIYTTNRIEAALKARFPDPKKLYLVFYEGINFGSCGTSPLPGHFPVMYVRGIYSSTYLTDAVALGGVSANVALDLTLPAAPFGATLGTETVTVSASSPGKVVFAAPLAMAHKKSEVLVPTVRPPDCVTNSFSADGTALGYREYVTIHEVFHGLGAVGPGAPHYNPVGHLTVASAAGAADLMYAGLAPWGCSASVPNPASSTCKLDPSRQEYFLLPAPAAGVTDLARSAFIKPTIAFPDVPVGW